MISVRGCAYFEQISNIVTISCVFGSRASFVPGLAARVGQNGMKRRHLMVAIALVSGPGWICRLLLQAIRDEPWKSGLRTKSGPC